MSWLIVWFLYLQMASRKRKSIGTRPKSQYDTYTWARTTSETNKRKRQWVTYDWLLGASPMHTASSASLTWRASLSMVEYTATHGIPNSWAVRITRTAISPLFAIRILSPLQVAWRAPQWRVWRCLRTWLTWPTCLGNLTLFAPAKKLHCELLVPAFPANKA